MLSARTRGFRVVSASFVGSVLVAFMTLSLARTSAFAQRRGSASRTPPGPACPAGQAISADTNGHCCWPGQVWSNSRATCVGIPTCPPGYTAEGEQCVVRCPDGQTTGPDTQSHCCWPAQAWSQTRATCVGIPACQSPWIVEGERCVRRETPAPVSTPPSPPAVPTPSAPPPQTEVASSATPPIEPQATPPVVCPNGQTVSSGHCCWPEQVWSTIQQICVGLPTCPSGLVARGNSCDPPALPPTPTPTPAPTPIAPAAPSPPVAPVAPANVVSVEQPVANADTSRRAVGFSDQPRSRRRISPVGPVMMGIGGIAAAVGVITWSVAEGQYSMLRMSCTSGTCPSNARATASSIHTLDIVTNVTLIGGGVLFATGVILLATLRTHDVATTPVLTFDPVLGTVGITGRF